MSKITSPKEIAEQTLFLGIQKTKTPTTTTFLLGILGGAFIGLGALFYTLIKADTTYSFATKQVFGGFVFSLGLILVVVAGANLFTGNNLITMAWAKQKITTKTMFYNWSIVFISNMLGAVSLALIVYFSGHIYMNNNGVAIAYLKMAEAKCSLPFYEAFLKGILCNILVCLAIWMATAGKSITDKIMAIIFPITLFVAAGFEHSIANLFIMPLAFCIANFSDVDYVTHHITIGRILHNIIPVVLGNIIGGGGFIGIMYYFIYIRKPI